MKTFNKQLTLQDILAITRLTTTATSHQTYTNVAELSEATETSICFYENEKYLDSFTNTHAGLVFIPETSTTATSHPNQIYLKTPTPYLDFMKLVTHWLQIETTTQQHTISAQASIDPTASIAENAHIAPFAVIEAQATIGENTVIQAHTVIMQGSHIGKNCLIYPHVTIYPNCKIGDNCIIHSGVVIGADGFGFTLIGENQVKIPQVGTVIIEDDVEIGANTCIDRSTIGTTLIKKNTKIDNLVQIGHNCKIDEHSILCAQVGLAGNSDIGKTVYLAGQVGVSGHLRIDDNTIVGAQSGVAGSLTSGRYFGSPASPAFEQKRIYIALKDLPAVVKWYKKQRVNNDG